MQRWDSSPSHPENRKLGSLFVRASHDSAAASAACQTRPATPRKIGVHSLLSGNFEIWEPLSFQSCLSRAVSDTSSEKLHGCRDPTLPILMDRISIAVRCVPLSTLARV